MAYIMVTTDNRTVVFAKHHSEYSYEDADGLTEILDDLTLAIQDSKTHHEKLEEKYQAFLAEMES